MNKINHKSVLLFFLRDLGVVLLFGLLAFLVAIGTIFEVKTFGGNTDQLWATMPMVMLIATLALLVLAGASLLVAWLTYLNYKWTLTDIGFKKESGVIFKRYVVIPYDKIQNVDIYRSLLHRILGLSAISIQTAGFSSGGSYAGRRQSSEGYLPGLSPQVAEKLQNDLLRHHRHTPVSK